MPLRPAPPMLCRTEAAAELEVLQGRDLRARWLLETSLYDRRLLQVHACGCGAM